MALQNCVNAQRGCTQRFGHGALLSHQQNCDFSPVECSQEGCTVTVNKKDLVSHQESCEFRSLACSDCQETLNQKEYENHSCVLPNELADVTSMLQRLQVSKDAE